MICEGVEKHLYFIKSECIGFIFATFFIRRFKGRGLNSECDIGILPIDNRSDILLTVIC